MSFGNALILQNLWLLSVMIAVELRNVVHLIVISYLCSNPAFKLATITLRRSQLTVSIQLDDSHWFKVSI